MNWSDFFQAIKTGNVPNLILFSGPEEYLKREAIAALRAAGGTAELEQLEAVCGEGVGAALRALEKEGAVTCETAARRKAGDRTRYMAALTGQAQEILPTLGRAPSRRAVVEFLSASGRTAAADVCYFTGASMATLRAMERAGLLTHPLSA